MCQLTEMDTRSIFSSPGWVIIPHWTSQLKNYYISDHTFVVCQLNTQKPATVMETITYRKYKLKLKKLRMTSSNHASTQWLSQLVMKTHVTWRWWQHSTTPRCEKSWVIMPRKRLKLWKRNQLCLGTTMKSKVLNVTEGRQNDSGCSTEVTP